MIVTFTGCVFIWLRINCFDFYFLGDLIHFYLNIFEFHFWHLYINKTNKFVQMFKLLPKSKYPTGMLYFLTEHTLIIYEQYKRFQEKKTSYLLEKVFEKDLVHVVQTAF